MITDDQALLRDSAGLVELTPSKWWRFEGVIAVNFRQTPGKYSAWWRDMEADEIADDRSLEVVLAACQAAIAADPGRAAAIRSKNAEKAARVARRQAEIDGGR